MSAASCKVLPLVSARHAAKQANGSGGTPSLCSLVNGRLHIIKQPFCMNSSIEGSNVRRIIKHPFCINHGVSTADAYIIGRHLRPLSFCKAHVLPHPHSNVPAFLSIRGVCSSAGHDDRRQPRKIPQDGEGSLQYTSNDHGSVASTPSDYCDPAQKHSTSYTERAVDAPDVIHDTTSCSCPCHDVPRGTCNSVLKESSAEKEGWQLLRAAMVYYCGSPVGTIAASDPADPNPLNYDQVFIRDFIPSAIAFLLKGEVEIVRNFLLHTLQLQSWEKTVDWFSPGQGLMPASFKVRLVPREVKAESPTNEETLDPDFGEAAIGRVAPVDSGLWWIILLRAYGKCTGDLSLQQRIDVQTGVKMVLKLCLEDGFDMFPTLLVTDGSCMIDRRMGIHGHPLEIQALFYSALRCAREMLPADDTLSPAISNRLLSLSFHIREYYWLDMKRLNTIYRYKTEEYSHEAVNKFNIYPDQIPAWLVDWMPDRGGYLIGNLQPAHMDFRFFSLGNLWSIVGSLATPEQSHAILDLIEAKWTDLVGSMPLKICYPALVDNEWQIITGSDPKNTPWSYHNGGSWPTLLWQLTVACLKMKRPDLACKAAQVAEERLAADKWPEYYDLKSGKFVGKQARLHQTWTIAGFLVARQLLRSPEAVHMLALGYDDSDTALLQSRSRYNRGKRIDTSTQTPPTIPPPFPLK